ncbi:MAG TPA: nucleotidyltransferase family protein [Gemmatimonadaceae bacterium]|nr:nucleotidyltransferase family protein [Gemmatimonadaceae bacterium]
MIHDADNEARLRALVDRDIDWEHLRRNALKHGIIPLVYQRLWESCRDLVPAIVLARLRADHRENTIRSLGVTAELLRLLDLLEQHGVPAIPYKGPALAAHVYGNLSIRQFGDLDILVHMEDASNAMRILCQHGYTTDGWPEPPDEAAFLKRAHVHSFHSPDHAVHLELHWDFTPRELAFPLDLDALWRRLQRRPLGSAEVLSLPPEDLLLILCVHGAKHCWSRLKSVRDVGEVVDAHSDMDWDRVLVDSRSLGAHRMLSLGIFLASELLGAAVPLEVRRHIDEDLMVPHLAGDVRARLFRDDVRHSVSADAQLFYMKMRERVRERLPQAVRFVRRYAHERLYGPATGAA